MAWKKRLMHMKFFLQMKLSANELDRIVLLMRPRQSLMNSKGKNSKILITVCQNTNDFFWLYNYITDGEIIEK
jgi:hypothetical protein